MLHNPCGVCYGAGVFRFPLVDMLHSVGIKKKNMCEVVWVCGLMSVYMGVT